MFQLLLVVVVVVYGCRYAFTPVVVRVDVDKDVVCVEYEFPNLCRDITVAIESGPLHDRQIISRSTELGLPFFDSRHLILQNRCVARRFCIERKGKDPHLLLPKEKSFRLYKKVTNIDVIRLENDVLTLSFCRGGQ